MQKEADKLPKSDTKTFECHNGFTFLEMKSLRGLSSSNSTNANKISPKVAYGKSTRHLLMKKIRQNT